MMAYKSFGGLFPCMPADIICSLGPMSKERNVLEGGGASAPHPHRRRCTTIRKLQHDSHATQ